jgi:ribosomal protein S18 acetylase RimI-like enzyme/two-component sensor histidine kinase
MNFTRYPFIRNLTQEDEERIGKSPLLNIDTFIIPSPYITDASLEKDYDLSFVWVEEEELLGYILVYSNRESNRYHIYRQSTSPFARGKGIGSAFMEALSGVLPSDALLYLYVWQKQLDSINFFRRAGFITGNPIAYRKLIFYYMSAHAEDILKASEAKTEDKKNGKEELGKIRHDAAKNAKLIFDMVNMLSADNYKKVIEDINRETTALINMLNSYRDTLEYIHDIDIQEFILERLVPFIKASKVPCRINLSLRSGVTEVLANYVEVGRALINLLANSLDAVREAGRTGEIRISLDEEEERIILGIRDNGIGITPDRLKTDPKGIPLFVGNTTKERDGSGIGTRQIFSAFGSENIKVSSVRGVYTDWTISLTKSVRGDVNSETAMEAKFAETLRTAELPSPALFSDRSEVVRFIWRMRRMELLSYELILRFSSFNNIREIYRSILGYVYGHGSFRKLRKFIESKRIDNEKTRYRLLTVIQKIKRSRQFLSLHTNPRDFLGTLLGSYGLAVDVTIIFTFNPVTGDFFATDRKLAEHLDFVPYLGADREKLLRGEFCGDMKDPGKPLYLGVWSISGKDDLYYKLQLLREGAKKLIDIGISPRKKLGFYQTTYNNYSLELDTYRTVTLEEFGSMDTDQLMTFTVKSDEEMQGILSVD